MAIPTEIARDILEGYRTRRVENLFAQSSASYVLHEVGEAEENFPRFDPALIDKVTISAYSILAAGVSLAEVEPSAEAIAAMEKAAVLLNNVHLPHAQNNPASGFHILVASMAFYASGQYSRAFVSIRKVETQTDLARMVALFIRKRPNELIIQLNPYLLADLSNFNDPWDICEHAVTTAIARSLSLVLEYFATGELLHFEAADSTLNIAMNLAQDYESPSHWWIARLLLLMIQRNGDASLWRILPPFFPDDLSLLNRYIRLLLFGKQPVTELWCSQREAVPVALDQPRHGAVVNMRTSAGKTRVAELAILQTLSVDSSAKILYLAPFRSLALEIEQTLGQVFDWCGFHVSHLYGGFRLSAADRQLAEDSSITIATPEKARAILRSSPELFDNVKLIVVDEGHLIGANERLVKNELFLDHLRFIANATECRIIMLSAVLPNPAHLAEWVTGDPENVVRSEWKPSAERFGLLRWQGDHVRIDWRGEFESFNPRFVQSRPLGWGKRRNPFPNNKNEAVAATAARLASVGPIMIFSARANSIPGLAKATLMALGETPPEHPWPNAVWKAFLATCEEELPNDAIELKSARCGVICHSNRLPTQVRMATELLMRSVPPKIIIASTTLAQGVNIGISSVIVATPYQGRHPIDHRDFWNICGRAGRAFVDGEGKILYAIDETESPWKVRKSRQLADKYFDVANVDPVESGLLFALHLIRNTAEKADVDFEQLMTMVAENDFSGLGENAASCSGILDFIDDGLLALQEDGKANPRNGEPEDWVDNVFRGSLAAIQSEDGMFSLTRDEFLQFIRTRTEAILRMCPDSAERKAYVATGLPLSAAKNLFRDRDVFVQKAQEIADAEWSLQAIVEFIAWVEEWARDHSTSVVEELPESAVMDLIRKDWIAGTPIREILKKTNKADGICKSIYGYQIPWLIHAASQQLRQMDNEELSDKLASVALLVELGVPNESAAWIFLAGIRSRAASTELAQCGVELGESPSAVRRRLRDRGVLNELASRVCEATRAWLDLHWADSARESIDLPKFPPFDHEDLEGVNTILVRTKGELTYLCTPDGTQRMAVKVSEKWPFDRIADDYRFSFVKSDGRFQFTIRSPKDIVDDDGA
ncbi:MAG: DEAD/DEAH box helicase [Deltaproteobacteria bacterium]|jgi:replicative superfamily II helicase|nr:DEAD/DEAH box helicase [Deltaproteobacteria bacterium]MDL1988787.1 DEAD/DEAH box helicase [Deltaproteobacteria bacterium]